MSIERKSGILLHISSLPSEFGIGDFGHNARKFIDKVHNMGCKLWQILPLGPLGPGNSPYQAYSAYAIDPIYISISDLAEWKLLDKANLNSDENFSSKKVQFESVRIYKENVLKTAYLEFSTRSEHEMSNEYEAFLNEHGWWLNDYAMYTVLKANNNNSCWNEWDTIYKTRNELVLADFQQENWLEFDFVRFKQFIAFRQWFRLKEYANYFDVEIFGDIPLYVSLDSSDVWANQTIFELDENGKPLKVGGVPPDYFSEDGQLWGNPLFDWNALAKTNYQWWIARLYFS